MTCPAVASFLLPDFRHDPSLFHLLPQMGELGRRFAGHLSSFASHCGSPYVGYPFATLFIFRSKSNVRQQYQLATEA
jgi:hypothetical protein